LSGHRRLLRAAGLVDAGDIGGVLAQSDIIMSVCPPSVALEVAQACAGHRGVFVDANAVSAATARQAASKGWRWIAEMEEIAATFAAVGVPDGFHRAAAEVYRRCSPA
jgi:saccharopine dehydrogenase-like NADP-dependent oxidoreductase